LKTVRLFHTRASDAGIERSTRGERKLRGAHTGSLRSPCQIAATL
jgi:hypothetical protein